MGSFAEILLHIWVVLFGGCDVLVIHSHVQKVEKRHNHLINACHDVRNISLGSVQGPCPLMSLMSPIVFPQNCMSNIVNEVY